MASPQSPARAGARPHRETADWSADDASHRQRDRGLLLEYVASRPNAVVDEALLQSLADLPLFQAIQVVHRFCEGLGPRIVNRQAYGSGIIRMTQRWWTSPEDVQTSRGPNTQLLVQMCIEDALNPDVFTPVVCHVMQMLSKEQVVSVASGFGQYSFALHVANDSYYAKQQLFLSMLHAALIQSPSATLLNINVFETPEIAANEAALQGRKRADDSAAKQLRGMLTEFIARTCARCKTFRESDLDGPCRDFLGRHALLLAMQAVEHFARSVSNHVVKKSAFLMGILRSQEDHWANSISASEFPGGAAALLSLNPRLLLRIANLCLDGHCKPTDFQPEVCIELQHLEVDLAIKVVLQFNSNKRISAGARGGVMSRSKFFMAIIRNHCHAASNGLIPIALPAPAMSLQRSSSDSGSGESELNVLAKPFIPISFQQSPKQGPSPTPVTTAAASTSSSVPSVSAPTSAQTPISPTRKSVVGASPTSPPLTTQAPASASQQPMSPRKNFSPCPSPVPTSSLTLSAAATPSAPSSGEAELKRLLDSSRDAIAHLTSALVRTRTNEIRLQRALEEAQHEVQRLQNQLSQFTGTRM